MKVTMKLKIAGSRNGVRWPEAGGVVELPGNEAVDLITQGLAQPLVERAELEKATAPAPEKRAEPEAAPAKKATGGIFGKKRKS